MTDTTNVGKWDRWYLGLTTDTPQTYGDTITYEMGVEWLRGSNLVYDFGCGKGGFQKVATEKMEPWPLLDTFPVLGVDGSKTPFANIIADLVEFKVDTDVFSEDFKASVFMRHVIEHDYRWRRILENALESFTYRMVLVLFTPAQRETHEIAWNEDPGVPDIGFETAELVAICAQHHVVGEVATYRTNTQYGEETVFLLEKQSDAPSS